MFISAKTSSLLQRCKKLCDRDDNIRKHDDPPTPSIPPTVKRKIMITHYILYSTTISKTND